MKLPIQTLGLMAAGVLIGTALSPVAAQQSGTDGQVALRSDGALYLIQNGQRRWISTATLSDADINAIPEGDPVMTGLALAGSADAQAKPAAPAPAAAAPPAGAGSTGATPAATAKPGAAPAATTTTAGAPKPSDDPNETLSPDIAIEVDLDGSTKIDPGDERKVDIKTVKDATCELKVRLVDGTELTEDSRNADTKGKCTFNIQIPDDAKPGGAWISGAARVGGKVNRQDIAIEVSKKK